MSQREYHAIVLSKMRAGVEIYHVMVMTSGPDEPTMFAGLTPIPVTDRALALRYATLIARRHASRSFDPWGDVDGQPVALNVPVDP